MTRPSRAEMRAMAESAERSAARSDRAAESGDRDAANPDNSPTHRAQAATAAKFARGHAQEYREDAAKLREGYLPEEDW